MKILEERYQDDPLRYMPGPNYSRSLITTLAGEQIETKPISTQHNPNFYPVQITDVVMNEQNNDYYERKFAS